MSQKVCMFVWNHFTNDARVLRECTALSEAGYEVDLIAIHDWKQPNMAKREKRNENFNLIRVNNRLKILGVANRVKRIAMRNIVTKAASVLFAALALWQAPIVTLILLALFSMLIVKKIRQNLSRSYIASQMIYHGLKRNYSIYHSNDLNTLPQGVLCSKILTFKRKKLIYDSHEIQTSRTGYNSKWYGIAENFYLKFVDVTIHENHTRAAYHEKLYGTYPEVLHNYPFVQRPELNDSVNMHELLGLPKDEPILLYQGGIQIGRGLEKIVEAVPMFKRGTMVFIGDGKQKPSLQKRVIELGLEDKIRFIDKIPVEQLLHYTRNAYLGFQVLNNICYNHYSASSNKLFEYMMCGIPVVACSFPEIKKVVEGNQTGICIDSHSPESIAEGVNFLLDNPDVHQQMKENCFTARHKYNWDVEKENFLKIYKKCNYAV
ncbi:glycosyl transferase [Fictibacillus phosphorivorans]|uniref:Glycosyl transferase n=1 Tax=Fictibacillus phosphorivorans TaxID=1221500 RepID=A0A165MZQ1_9BACL|nr:glycosyltransferase [Fictibacillus phosphorivorans]KZE64064.1 glycosyl transferase [Fictibacillus phosphorivorans]